MWADHETKLDLLGFDHLASAVKGIVANDKLLPATIGVFGDWGSGKSSLLKMVAENELADTSGVLVLHFNGWLFEGFDDAKSALLETIVGELLARKEGSLSDDAKRIGVKLLRRINWFRVAATTGRAALRYGAAAVAGGPAGLGLAAAADVPKVLEKAKESLEGISGEDLAGLFSREAQDTSYGSIRDFRADFTSLLSATDIEKLVVVIDDLDRCLPDTVIETLEAIKLFLFVPQSAFIIGADERLVKYAVQRRFPELPGIRTEVGRDYLEKLIQYPIRIPSLGRAEVETYTSLLFTQRAGMSHEVLQKCAAWAFSDENIRTGRAFGAATAEEVLTGECAIAEVPAELKEGLSLASRISRILAAGLSGNPRQCKRFLNMLVMRLGMARSRGVELDQNVLVKLMLLEYLRPETFRRLAQLQAEQEGVVSELKVLESAAAPSAESAAEKKENPENGQEPLPAEVRLWVDDEFTRQWLQLEPSLAGTDLRPYVFFSRDVLGPLGVAIQRLSPPAQEALGKLLSPSEGARTNGLKAAGALGTADAAAVFQELTSRARGEHDWSTEGCVFRVLFEYVGARSELASELVTFLRQAPDSQLTLDVVPRLRNACKGTAAQSVAEELIEKWASSSDNSQLQKAASKKPRNAQRLG